MAKNIKFYEDSLKSRKKVLHYIIELDKDDTKEDAFFLPFNGQRRGVL